jgi:GT2 family glycosyltransferase
MARLSIIIVNWNSGELLRRCVQSIPAREADVDVDVVVVDNASSDSSMAGLLCQAPMQELREQRNLGFGRACNRGVAHADADLILFLNPDTRLEPGALAAAAAALVAVVGVVGVRLIDDDGVTQRSCARTPTSFTFWRTILGLDALGVPGRSLHMVEWDHLSRRDVDHVMGACYLMRRQDFVDVGGFDVRFFVFLEDLDLSQRVRASGRRVLFLGDVAVHHSGGGTTRARTGVRLMYALESRLRYAHKHFSLVETAGLAAGTFLIEPPLRMARALLEREPAEVGPIVRGVLGALRRLAS